ncbi:alpha carbonic anhydrase 7-like [Quercus lobata]|uniref:Carbonic anhydrase n=1 Tax=Quercus lobata TaxID=97700 RepID=A0A7N2M613_QUELO|nr:alpha carbonic anhydrase 7-like [Quercus lobata]
MKNPSKLIFVASFVFFAILIKSTTAQEVEDEREFDYLQGSEKGPGHWGDLNKDWKACKNGNMQSPIDLSSKRVKVIPKLMDLKRNYKPCNATVKNRGHDISLKWEGDAGSIQINGTDYFLDQGHWHSPSEHSINGRRYDLELHMVHLARDPNVTNKIAVVGLFYKIGHHDDFLSKLMRNILSMTDKKDERNMGVIDPREIKMGGKKYYKYMGSLTVPPCTEGVIWTINKKIRTVSREQVKSLRVAVHDYAEKNARPVQQLNNREIQLYGPNPTRTRN